MVDSNYFSHCDGEIEIISNKSCGNVYRANTFYECKGTLTLRHGNGCTVEDNYFIGNDAAKTGGVRLIGEDHIVRHNTMYGLAGDHYRAAICIVRGKENSALNEYYPVKNAKVYGNTIVNCKQAFCINYNSSSECTVAPVGVWIAENSIYIDSSCKNNYLFYLPSITGLDMRLSGNAVNRFGIYENLSPTDSEVRIESAMERPVIEPVATSGNTGCGADMLTAIGQHHTYTSVASKQIRNGKIFISIYNEKENSNHSAGTIGEYSVDGRCIGVR